jgi:hypothetical protein
MYNCHRDMRAFFRDEVRMTPRQIDQLREKRDTCRRVLRTRLRAYGLRPIGFKVQGSFAMNTMVGFDPEYDIDDGVYFEAGDLVGERGAPMSALEVRRTICEALQGGNWSDPPEIHANCVRAFYAHGFHVDLPIYRRRRYADLIHGVYRDRFELAGPVWRVSAATQVTDWFKTMNRKLSPDGDQFRRVVCLLKAFARSRDSWRTFRPSGFVIAALAAEQFHAAYGRDDVALRWTMLGIAQRLARDQRVEHPILDEDICEPGNPRNRNWGRVMADKLAYLRVLDDRRCNEDEALTAWDNVFGWGFAWD